MIPISPTHHSKPNLLCTCEAQPKPVMNTTAGIPAASAHRTFGQTARVLFAFMLTFCFATLGASAQTPAHLGTDVASFPTYTTYSLNDLGAFRQVRILANNTTTAGNVKWEFTIDNGGSPDYSQNWRPYTIG